MPFYEHRFSFAGKKVAQFKETLFDTQKLAFRVTRAYEASQTWLEQFEVLLAQPEAATLEALVVGMWSDEQYDDGSQPVVEALVAAKDKLKSLKAIFLGDIVCEECEVSWLHQSDVSPIFAAYPNLEAFAVRGSGDLHFGTLSHSSLKHLTVQSGGLDVQIVRDILASDFPNLEHLDLYLGMEDYGANVTLEDLMPLLQGELFPKLTTLGLRNSIFTDEIAAAIATAPILERIKTLDLSLGVLSDEGAKVFSSAEKLGSLEKLDIHYHFVNAEPLVELKAHLRKLKIKIDASEAQEPDEDDGRSPQIGE
jgi:hypothetical protein